VLAEEGPEDEAVPLDAEHLWIVDPICGSRNYVQGIPIFCNPIALRTGRNPVGVVYDPTATSCSPPRLSSHATLNGKTIGVQQISEGYDAFEKAWVGTDWPHEPDKLDQALQIAAVMSRQVITLNAMGSPALGICNVAVGRWHAYWALDLRIWDMAAAGLILIRAGGTLTDDHGASWLFSTGGYIASNSIIHGWTMRCLQRVLRTESRRLPAAAAPTPSATAPKALRPGKFPRPGTKRLTPRRERWRDHREPGSRASLFNNCVRKRGTFFQLPPPARAVVRLAGAKGSAVAPS
jgi:myo-inositol-1(or 4)-monophosphatase